MLYRRQHVVNGLKQANVKWPRKAIDRSVGPLSGQKAMVLYCK